MTGTRSQAVSALDRAHRINVARAKLKRELAEQPNRQAAARRLKLAIFCGPLAVESMRAVELLAAGMYMGPKRAAVVLEALDIPVDARFRDISMDKRDEMVRFVATHTPQSVCAARKQRAA